MGSPGESPDRIETLRLLMERLCAPDLTLAEAKELLPSLAELLECRRPEPDPGRLGSGLRAAARQG